MTRQTETRIERPLPASDDLFDEAGSRHYCRYTKSPWVATLFKGNLGVKENGPKQNLAPVGFEPTTSGTDLPVLYRLSYEASTGASRGNLGSEFAVYIEMI